MSSVGDNFDEEQEQNKGYNVWNIMDYHYEAVFCNADVFPTRFACRETLCKMGIANDVDDLLARMAMPLLARMDYPTYPEATKHLLSTITIGHGTQGKGHLAFNVGNRRYWLSVERFCSLYGFPEKKYEATPTFLKERAVWRNIAIDESPFSTRTWLSDVKNPTVRYTLQLLANTIFARGQVTSATTTELMALYNGVGGLMRTSSGKHLLARTKHNPGSLFIDNLVGIKHEWEFPNNPQVFIGGMLTPLFRDVGVNLDIFETLPERAYMDCDYLLQTKSLVERSELHGVYSHLFLERHGQPKIFLLPNPDFTHTDTHEALSFQVPPDLTYSPSAPYDAPPTDD